MNILLVDDVSDNREVLEGLIKQYTRINDISCNVKHAANGEEAAQITDNNAIDLVFMDIMMPVMDGLEATKVIKKSHPSIMIIVVSSENDEKVKDEILQAGAEDYISKPFSSSIMLSRLKNYNKLINSRNTIGYQTKAVNVFTHSIYSYQVKFYLSNNDELAQFWETMLVRLEFQHRIADLSDFVRFIFRLGSYQLQKSYKCHVFLEEDEQCFYFTMDNMKLLSCEVIHNMINKFYTATCYELQGDLLSFALPKEGQETPFNISTVVDIPEPEAKVALPICTVQKETLQTYDILDVDSLHEFEHIVSKLKTEISMMGSSSLEIDDIDTMNDYIKQLAATLSISRDAYEISESLRTFSILLDEYSQPFLDMSNDLAHMMTSFVNDLVMWKDMIFYSGAPSVDFLNSSISSNVQMIRAIFIHDDSSEEDIDDIFDF